MYIIIIFSFQLNSYDIYMIEGFPRSDRLDKPWSQVWFPPPRYVPSFLSRILGLSIPAARRFSSNECINTTRSILYVVLIMKRGKDSKWSRLSSTSRK